MTDDTVKRLCPVWTTVEVLRQASGAQPYFSDGRHANCEDYGECAFQVPTGDGKTGCGLVRRAVECAEVLPEVREWRGAPEFVDVRTVENRTFTVRRSDILALEHWPGEGESGTDAYYVTLQNPINVPHTHSCRITPAAYANLRAQLLGDWERPASAHSLSGDVRVDLFGDGSVSLRLAHGFFHLPEVDQNELLTQAVELAREQLDSRKGQANG